MESRKSIAASCQLSWRYYMRGNEYETNIYWNESVWLLSGRKNWFHRQKSGFVFDHRRYRCGKNHNFWCNMLCVIWGNQRWQAQRWDDVQSVCKTRRKDRSKILLWLRWSEVFGYEKSGSAQMEQKRGAVKDNDGHKGESYIAGWYRICRENQGNKRKNTADHWTGV